MAPGWRGEQPQLQQRDLLGEEGGAGPGNASQDLDGMLERRLSDKTRPRVVASGNRAAWVEHQRVLEAIPGLKHRAACC